MPVFLLLCFFFFPSYFDFLVAFEKEQKSSFFDLQEM